MREATVLSLILILCAVVLLKLPSCTKEKEEGNIPPAIKAMIKQKSGCLCEPFAQEFKWRSQTIYLFTCGGPACDCMTLYYNENGQKVEMDPGYLPDQFRQEAVFIREIWRCKQ